MTSIRVGQWVVSLLAFGFVHGAHAQTSQNTDLLLKAEQAKKIAEATLDADVKDAISTAQRLSASAPEKAVQNLKATLVKVDTASGISESKRNDLATQIQSVISGIQKGNRPVATVKLDPKVLERIEKSRKTVDAGLAEATEVQTAIADISRDLEAKRDREARSKIAALATKYPNNAAVITLQSQQDTADSIAEAKEIAKLSADRFRASLNDVQRSAIPILGDIEFPKDYAAKMERRMKLNAPKLTAEEEKLIQSLEAPISKGLKDAPFEEAVQMMSTTIDQKIYLDKRSLEDLGLDLRKPVDVPGGVKARTALRVMLQQNNLTFIIRDNIIQVVSLEKAKEMMVTRAYDVRDLVSSGGLFNNPLQWGPYLDALQTESNARVIIDAIHKSIEPKVWDVTGGPATVVFHYPTMSIIVKAPSDIHADLHKKLFGRKK